MAITTHVSSEIAVSGEAKVDSVHGSVRVINGQGEVRLLKAGDIVHVGERIVADADGSAVLLTASGDSLVIEGGRLVGLDESILNPQAVPDTHEAALQAPSVEQQAASDTNAILQALEAGQDPFAALAPAAAGLSGAGGEDGGLTFIRLARITEGLTDIGLVGSFDIANVQQNDLGGTLPALSVNNGVTISDLTPTAQGGEGTVSEAALSIGSNPSATTESMSGSFKVTAADGLDEIVIGGVKVVDNNALTANTTIITALGSTITITGFDPATGVVSYTYTLNTAETHASGDGNNSLFDNVAVTATDVDGSSSNGTLSVNIVDDVPTASLDTNSVAAGTVGPVTGQVLTNDVFGADGPATTSPVGGVVGIAAGTTAGGEDANVGTPIHGLYGTLTLKADGSYTYTRDVGSQGGHDDVFTYTIKDGDGDLSHTTLTISIGDATPTVSIPEAGGSDTTVYEAGLPARVGEPAGSNSAATSETTSGSIGFTSPDGIQAVSLGGHVLTGTSTTFPVETLPNGTTGQLTASYVYDAATGIG
ncbi:retention module-containing protein, partial [Pseudogulbenkiania subflava]